MKLRIRWEMKKTHSKPESEPEVVEVEEVVAERWKIVYKLFGKQLEKGNFQTEQDAIQWAKTENLYNRCENEPDIFRYTRFANQD